MPTVKDPTRILVSQVEPVSIAHRFDLHHLEGSERVAALGVGQKTEWNRNVIAHHEEVLRCNGRNAGRFLGS
jgi:hypothetical protein